MKVRRALISSSRMGSGRLPLPTISTYPTLSEPAACFVLQTAQNNSRKKAAPQFPSYDPSTGSDVSQSLGAARYIAYPADPLPVSRGGISSAGHTNEEIGLFGSFRWFGSEAFDETRDDSARFVAFLQLPSRRSLLQYDEYAKG